MGLQLSADRGQELHFPDLPENLGDPVRGLEKKALAVVPGVQDLLIPPLVPETVLDGSTRKDRSIRMLPKDWERKEGLWSDLL